MINKDKNIKIIDLGFAMDLLPHSKRNPDSTLQPMDASKLEHVTIPDASGSKRYTAPEILQNKEHSPILADIWSCGVILSILSSGNFPFRGKDSDDATDTWKQIQQSFEEIQGPILPETIPRALQSLINGLLVIDPKSRFRLNDTRGFLATVFQHPWFKKRGEPVEESEFTSLGIKQKDGRWVWEKEDQKRKTCSSPSNDHDDNIAVKAKRTGQMGPTCKTSESPTNDHKNNILLRWRNAHRCPLKKSSAKKVKFSPGKNRQKHFPQPSKQKSKGVRNNLRKSTTSKRRQEYQQYFKLKFK